jgi:hypothetical protein
LQITGLHETVVAEFDARFADGRLLAFADSIDKRSPAVHTVWDFLRSKFALRMVEPAARYLKTADAFALECYARPSAISREPPLVTFDNQASPWAISRDHAYQPATDPGGFLSLAAFSQVIHSLPIPLLGLPWHYATYLPHMVFLAHEVGHAAERDFGLEPSLTAALDKSGVDPDHLHGWRSWQREVFADLFAIFTTEMPYAVSLAEILRADPERLQSAVRNDGQWTDYPTAALRILLNAEALKQCGVADAEAFRDSWLALCPSHAMADWEPDLPKVVEAYYKAANLPASAAWTPENQRQARTIAKILAQGGALRYSDVYPTRVLVAAARDLIDQPEHWPKLIDHAVQSRPPGLLQQVDGRPHGEDEAEAKEIAAGAALASTLFAAIS